MMNPYVILAVVALWGTSVGGSFFYGQKVGKDSEVATQAREDVIVKKATDAAQLGAAAAIAANKPRNVTLRQEIQGEIRTNTIYAECKHSPEQLQRINSALAGPDPITVGGGSVPKAVAPVVK